MSEMKQMLVVRKDLNMRKGKIAAQCAHASLSILKNMMTPNGKVVLKSIPEDFKNWLFGLQTKICVSVSSEEELLEVYNKAKDAGLLCSLIRDAGKTEFNGIPTLTVAAIGPAKAEDLYKITDHLNLL